ncbi:MAG TPA: hypothetical protein VNZ22_03675, partial [Bacillota bacterium]|nr:hypothetical protein [Bacillota bacterium]
MKATSRPKDQFLCPASAPYSAEHALLDSYLSHPKTSSLKADTGTMSKEVQLRLLVATLERMAFQKTRKALQPSLGELVQLLAGRKLPYDENDISQLLDYAATVLRPADPKHVQWEELNSPFPGLVPVLLDNLELASHKQPLSQQQLKHLGRLHEAIQPMEHWGGYAKTLRRIEALLRPTPAGLPDEGEAWAHAIREDIDQMPSQPRAAWLALLENAPKASSAKPTAKWKKQADALLAAVGTEEFAQRTELWLGLVGLRASTRIQPRNESLLRALVWYASLLTGETVCRALANAVEGGLRKLPTGGLYASSITKACIAALEAIPGLEPIAQLSRLQYRVKSPWGQEEIQKAFLKAVQRSGLAPAEVEELTLPTFGLETDSGLHQQVGVLTAELRIEGTHSVKLRWLDAHDVLLESGPKLSPAEAPQAKALKRLTSDIEKMLGAQRDRIERL